MAECKNWLEWLNVTRFASMSEDEKANFSKSLFYIRDKVLELARIREGDKILDIGTGTGLLAFGALEKISDKGLVIFSDISKECLNYCENICKQYYSQKNAEFLYASCEKIDLQSLYLNKVLMRSVLAHIVDKQPAINEIHRILRFGGEFIAFEPLLSTNVRYHQLTTAEEIDDWAEFKKAEDEIMSNPNNSLTNFDEHTLEVNLRNAGFIKVTIDLQDVISQYVVTENMVPTWFDSVQSPNHPSMKDNFLNYFSEDKVNKYISQLQNVLSGKEISTSVKVAWIKALK